MTCARVVMSAVICSGLVITAFTAIEHITGYPKNRRNYFRFFRGIIISVLIAQMSVIGFGGYRAHPSSLFLFFTLIYLSSPLEYIRYHTFLYPGRKIPLPVKASLLPLLPVFVLEVFIHTRPFGQKAALFNGFFSDPFHHRLIYVLAACLLVNVFFFCLLLGTEITSLKKSALKGPMRFSIMISVITLVSIALSCVYYFTLNTDFILLGTAGICLSTILYFLFKNRFPDFFQLLVREMKQERYRRTLLKGIDHAAVHERLSDLMREEKLYQDMDLRMKDVAARLLITPHQFSQLLNERIKTDFRNFVNRYRVDEARRLLLENPERSIISICFEVGFNSKTSFNITFKKMTGLSPKEYREKSGK